MSEWRPIETAPKDGSWVLVWPYSVPGGLKISMVARWHQPANTRFEGFWTGGTRSIRPTHWMPLPEAPKP